MKMLIVQIYSNLVLLLIGILVPFLTSRNIFGCITTLGLLVVDLTHLASQITWFDTVQTDIETLTIGWMWVFWMGNILSGGIIQGIFWASETILQCTILHVTSLTVCSIGPHTCARVLVKVKSSGTFYFGVLTFDTVEENIADGWIGMGKESITTWAEVISPWWL